MPPRLARLVAGVVAVALIGVALLVRGALADDDEPTVGSDRGGETATGDPAADDGGAFTLACDADLGDVCQALRPLGDVQILTGGTALTLDLQVDAWVTLDPMPGVRATARDEAEPEVRPIGSTTLSLLTSQGGGIECDGPTSCVVDAAREQKVGVPGSATSLGTVVEAALAVAEVPRVARVGRTAFPDVVEALSPALDERSPAATDQQVNRYLTQRGSFAGVITTAGAAERAVGSAQGEGKVAVPLEPEVTIGVVVAGYGGRGPQAIAAVRDAVSRETLRDAGFAGAAAASDGLPEADIVYALREELGR